MSSSRTAVALLVTVFTLGVAATAEARGVKKGVVEPGKYKTWGQDIDEVEILKTFKMSDYEKVAVVPFDTSETPMPASSEKSYDSIKSVLASFNETLVESIRDEMKTKASVSAVPKDPKASKTLLVRGKVLDISPGSRAKRYLGGFGAGSAGNKVSAELVDSASGKVLLRFTQDRHSGGTMKFGGGNDVSVMRDSIHAVGQDIAHILDSF